MLRTLRSRITVAVAIVAGLSVLVTAFVAFRLVDRYARTQAFQELHRDAFVLANEAEDPRPGHFQVARKLLQASGDHFAILTPAGIRAVGDEIGARIAQKVSLNLHGFPEANGLLRQGTVFVDRADYAYVLVHIRGPRALPVGVVLGRALSLTNKLAGSILRRMLLAGLFAIGIGILAAWIVSRRMAGSMQHLADATASIAAGDLDHRVPVEGNDDVADIARRFNAMAVSIAESRRRERELLANVSHELRTPITAIRGFAQALTDGTATEPSERTRAFNVIESESIRLERLIGDVIDLVRLGSQEVRLSLEPTDVSKILREATDAQGPNVDSAGVVLEASIEPGLQTVTDGVRVGQILSNLVDNAVRITPTGGVVRVSARREIDWIEIDVADNGPGIAATDLPHVFERGYLWKSYSGERPVGTGLGLAIVRSLVDTLGGRIAVMSEPGSGTVFEFRLPIR